MGSGVAMATILGVPLGSLAGQHLGWRGTFWSVAALAAVAAVIIGRFVPATGTTATTSVRSELSAFRESRLWLVLGATVLVMGGCMGTFSFLTPLLTDRAGIAESLVPVVFVCFGIGSMIGTNVAGRFADQRPIATFLGAALGALIILVLLVPLSGSAVSAVILITLLGVVTMAVPPVATGLSARLAATAPTLAVAFTVSAFNGGIAIGSLIGGSTLNTSLGAAGPAAVGVLMVALGLIPLAALAVKRADHAETAEHRHKPNPCASRELVSA
jgi:DHA1 family inner membrane transport protein